MNMIPAALRRRPPAAVLTETRAELEAAHVKLGELEAQRAAALEDDAAAGVLAFDRQIHDTHALIYALTDRVKVFEQRTADRNAEKRKADYDKAVNGIAGRALGMSGLVQDLAAAIEAVGNKLEQLAVGQRSVLRDWPSDHVQMPFANQLGLADAEQAIAEAFAVFDRQKFGRWPDWTMERKLAHVKEIATDFRKAEVSNYDELIAGLRAGSPKPDGSKTEEGQAA
jgi:hypothetical protein